MRNPRKLDTDSIQDRMARLQASVSSGTMNLEEVYRELIALTGELLFIAEDFESRRMNEIVPGANVTF